MMMITREGRLFLSNVLLGFAPANITEWRIELYRAPVQLRLDLVREDFTFCDWTSYTPANTFTTSGPFLDGAGHPVINYRSVQYDFDQPSNPQIVYGYTLSWVVFFQPHLAVVAQLEEPIVLTRAGQGFTLNPQFRWMG